MSQMMQTMHDPVYREKIEQKMAGLKSDPELSNIMQELEGGGPAAMMKCVLSTRPRASFGMHQTVPVPAVKRGGPLLYQHLWHSASTVLAGTGTTQRCWRN